MINKLQELVDSEWAKKPDKREAMLLTTIGMAGEVGEIADNVKRFAWYDVPLDMDNLLEESGDVLHYLMACLSLQGFTLDDAATHQYLKYNKRFPNGWNEEEAVLKRDHKE